MKPGVMFGGPEASIFPRSSNDMSLISFLVVGRSISEIREEPTRYRMRQETMLPKFGSPKREPAPQPEQAKPPLDGRQQIQATNGVSEPAPFMAREAATGA